MRRRSCTASFLSCVTDDLCAYDSVSRAASTPCTGLKGLRREQIRSRVEVKIWGRECNRLKAEEQQFERIFEAGYRFVTTVALFSLTKKGGKRKGEKKLVG